MAYSDLTTIKSILGETGSTNDTKIGNYQTMADNYINSWLVNVEPTIPVASPSIELVAIANEMTVALFYKFESGDTVTAEQAQQTWERYFTSTYRRPHFYSTTGTY